MVQWFSVAIDFEIQAVIFSIFKGRENNKNILQWNGLWFQRYSTSYLVLPNNSNKGDFSLFSFVHKWNDLTNNNWKDLNLNKANKFQMDLEHILMLFTTIIYYYKYYSFIVVFIPCIWPLSCRGVFQYNLILQNRIL